MTPFDDEQSRQVRAISDASHAHGAAQVAEELIAVAVRAYFAVRPATDCSAKHLCDIVMCALSEAEELERIA